MNKTDSEEKFKVKKGGRFGIGSDPGIQRVEKRLAEKISEINLPFEDEHKDHKGIIHTTSYEQLRQENIAGA